MSLARGTFAIVVALVVAAPGCYIKADSSRLLRATHVVVEVGYALDGDGYGVPYADPWPVLRTHLARVFRRTNPLIDFRAPVLLTDVPASLTGYTFSFQDAVAYAKQKRTVQSSGDTAAFYLLFLPGEFDSDYRLMGQTRVGDAVSAFSFASMNPAFQDAGIAGSKYGLSADAAASIIQELVMAHEIGHAIGLVDSGIPTVSDHGAPNNHCSSTTCLMAADIPMWPSFHAVAQDPTAIMFDDQCLADIDAVQ